MSKRKTKILLTVVSVVILVGIIFGVAYSLLPSRNSSPIAPSPNSQKTPTVTSSPSLKPSTLTTPPPSLNTGPAPDAFDIKVNFNASRGFNTSITEDVASAPLFVLQPGSNGTLPFTVTSVINESVNVSMDVFLGSTEAKSYGVQFNISPENFTLNPGGQVQSVLTISADANAPATLYYPIIEGQPNTSNYSGIGVSGPTLMIANFTPSCMYTSIQQTGTPPSGPTLNAHAGQKIIIAFDLPNSSETLNLNVTLPSGFASDFSSTPLKATFYYGSANIYMLNVQVPQDTGPGTYEVYVTGTRGSFTFQRSFYLAIT